MSRSTATRVAGVASRPTRFGRGDTMLGSERSYDDAVVVARAYRRKPVELGLAKDYGVRTENRRHGRAAIMLGAHCVLVLGGLR